MDLIVDGIIFETNPYGGIARIFKNILPILCDLDPKLKITLFLRNNRYVNVPEHKRISIIILSDFCNFRPRRLWKPFLKKAKFFYLKNSIKNNPKSIWMSTYFTRPPFKWHGKEVVWVHDMIYEFYPDKLQGAKDVIARKKAAVTASEKIICNSNTTAKDLLFFYPEFKNKTSVILLSHDPIFTYRKPSKRDRILSDPFLLYVGKRSSYKGFDTLLEAYLYCLLKESTKLVVVGAPWSVGELETINHFGLEDKIILFENIDDRMLNDLYNQAKAFIYPSLYEGFGIPLLKAMACGCPIVASRIPSTQEVAGDIPIYFEPEDPKSLADVLDQLQLNSMLNKRIEKGIEKASLYSWEKTALEFYNRLKELHDK